MKRKINFLSAILLLSFILSACDGQTGRTDSREDLAEVRENMQEVIENIDEALATNDISDFRNKANDAVSSLDGRIDEYLAEMDDAERRIDQNTRNQIIELKQMKTQVDFKLDLLEQDDYDNWDDEDNTETNRTTMGDEGTATATPETTMDDENLRTDQREVMYGPQLVDDLKNDLRDLRGKVEQFAQSLPRERED